MKYFVQNSWVNLAGQKTQRKPHLQGFKVVCVFLLCFRVAFYIGLWAPFRCVPPITLVTFLSDQSRSCLSGENLGEKSKVAALA